MALFPSFWLSDSPDITLFLAKVIGTCYFLYDICEIVKELISLFKIPLLTCKVRLQLIPGKPVSQPNLLQLPAKKRDKRLLLVQQYFSSPLIINLSQQLVSAGKCAFWPGAPLRKYLAKGWAPPWTMFAFLPSLPPPSVVKEPWKVIYSAKLVVSVIRGV